MCCGTWARPGLIELRNVKPKLRNFWFSQRVGWNRLGPGLAGGAMDRPGLVEPGILGPSVGVFGYSKISRQACSHEARPARMRPLGSLGWFLAGMVRPGHSQHEDPQNERRLVIID